MQTLIKSALDLLNWTQAFLRAVSEVSGSLTVVATVALVVFSDRRRSVIAPSIITRPPAPLLAMNAALFDFSI